MNKTTNWVVFAILCLSMALPVQAATANGLPSKTSYFIEKLNLSIFTFRTSSKIKTLDRYANERVNNIQTVYTAKEFAQIENFAGKYTDLKSTELSLIENEKITGGLLEAVKTATVEQQKTLSVVRDGLEDENIKQNITKVQEDIVNKSRGVISNVENKESADKFVDGVVTVWEDPQGLKGGATYAGGTTAGEATHAYATGTSAGGVNGVVVDGGQAKVVQGSNGDVKIVYAPGTGPSSVTKDDGKKVWVVQGSDGSTTQSSSSTGNVVQGGGGTATENESGNTVVGGGGQGSNNTGGGQNVVGGSSGTGGATVVGQ